MCGICFLSRNTLRQLTISWIQRQKRHGGMHQRYEYPFSDVKTDTPILFVCVFFFCLSKLCFSINIHGNILVFHLSYVCPVSPVSSAILTNPQCLLSHVYQGVCGLNYTVMSAALNINYFVCRIILISLDCYLPALVTCF